jgi:hypothetical protein
LPGKQANAITSYYIRKMRRGDAARKKKHDHFRSAIWGPARLVLQYRIEGIQRAVSRGSGYAEHCVSYYGARSLVRPNVQSTSVRSYGPKKDRDRLFGRDYRCSSSLFPYHVQSRRAQYRLEEASVGTSASQCAISPQASK